MEDANESYNNTIVKDTFRLISFFPTSTNSFYRNKLVKYFVTDLLGTRRTKDITAKLIGCKIVHTKQEKYVMGPFTNNQSKNRQQSVFDQVC